MKFREERPFADVDAAVKKLLEIANGVAADHAGRLSVGIINTQFKDAGGQLSGIQRRGESRDRSRIYNDARVGRISVFHPGRR